MAKPSVSIPDELLDEFDAHIWELQKNDKLPPGRIRSKLLAKFVADWLDGDPTEWAEARGDWAEEVAEGNGSNKPTMMAD